MSYRPEDRDKNNCPSRGLGLAAAVLGVGVGAALYYFCNRRSQNPHSEGSTSQWTCEQPNALPLHDFESSYITISEHTTTDTSMDSTDESDSEYTNRSESDERTDLSDETDNEYDSESYESSGDDWIASFDISITSSDSSESECFQPTLYISFESDTENEWDTSSSTDAVESMDEENSVSDLPTPPRVFAGIVDSNDYYAMPNVNYADLEANYVALPTININIDSELNNEWDVTHSAMDVPTNMSGVVNEPGSPLMSFFSHLSDIVVNRIPRRPTEDEQIKRLREQAFRERSWSLEECSICYEVMLLDQQVMRLPCAHNFHTACIATWLQEQRTCPYCRKPAE
ncbi:E3 ubiquitin-protein ligase Praja-2-like [Galleria mellonella]|uniref:E3 ubiquitin-protein ligase Praja-2-like n=1 Tax=Galleria mellonella TaxID=7137 RepID=A0A6J3C244_GALME|nr:E3 ubiquitin-protein ligase Praja-2-like [Galleria mellonella]XP_031766421.1 E3 ubiquitin-protein ligase Praja-2-like [Galleria mellonella]